AGFLRIRTELFALEFQEERHKVVELLLLVGAAIFLGVAGLGLLSAVVVFAFPEPRRLAVAFGLAVLYILGVAGLLWRIRRRLRDEPFSETVNQLKKDWECLTPPD